MFAIRRTAARTLSTSARVLKEEGSTSTVVQATERGQQQQVAEVRPEGTAVQAGVVSGAPGMSHESLYPNSLEEPGQEDAWFPTSEDV